jgi:hypothetical protein
MAVLASITINDQLAFVNLAEDAQEFTRRSSFEVLLDEDPKMAFNKEIVLTHRSMAMFYGRNLRGFGQVALAKIAALTANRYFIIEAVGKELNSADYENYFQSGYSNYMKLFRLALWYLYTYKNEKSSPNCPAKIAELAEKHKIPKLENFGSDDNVISHLVDWIKTNEADGFAILKDFKDSLKNLKNDSFPIIRDARTDLIMVSILGYENAYKNYVSELSIIKKGSSEITIFRRIDKVGVPQIVPVFVTPKFKITKSENDISSVKKDNSENKTNKDKLLPEKYDGKILLRDNDFVLIASSALYDYLPLSVATLLMNLKVKIIFFKTIKIKEEIVKIVQERYDQIIADYIKMVTDKSLFLLEKEDLLSMPHLQVEKPSEKFLENFNHKMNEYSKSPEVISDCSLYSVIYQRVADVSYIQNSLASKCKNLLM